MNKAECTQWLIEPMPKNVKHRIERLSGGEDVVHVAVMPDVHLSKEFCVGTAVATRSQIMPQLIGGDIGCGMAAMRVAETASVVTEKSSRQLLRLLQRFVPSNKHDHTSVADRLPVSLSQRTLSEKRLGKLAQRDGRFQIGTLGRGNHFLEFQSDVNHQLWLMIHSGSRAMGQAVTAHHVRFASQGDVAPFFDAESPAGQAYLNDMQWARDYASQNRRAMLQTTAMILKTLLAVDVHEDTLLESDHNHVRREQHGDEWIWVHRKGAQSARLGEEGVIPGSMGTSSFHVVGRGCDESLKSSSHGAGRRGSRTEAKSRISVKTLNREMRGIYFDQRKSNAIRDEAPSAYKDIRKVMQAQRELVKIVRELKPIVSYKAG